MSVAEGKLFNLDDETDEFEVIQPNPIGLEDDKNMESKIVYMEKSATSSICGDNVAGCSDPNDCGKSFPVSMYSSISGQSQNILESIYSFPPFVKNDQIEKLVNLLREEQSKNRNMLEQIMTVVTDLRKERNENNELRDQITTYKSLIEKERDKTSELTHELNLAKDSLHETVHTVKQFAEQNNQLASNVDKLTKHLENAESHNILIQEKLCANQMELDSKNEIINLLEKDKTEISILMENNRLAYRVNLDVLEEQMLQQYERSEVNFI